MSAVHYDSDDNGVFGARKASTNFKPPSISKATASNMSSLPTISKRGTLSKGSSQVKAMTISKKSEFAVTSLEVVGKESIVSRRPRIDKDIIFTPPPSDKKIPNLSGIGKTKQLLPVSADLMIDSATIIRSWNNWSEELFGVSSEEVVNKVPLSAFIAEISEFKELFAIYEHSIQVIS
jgi:hypothetical protein